MDQICRKQNRAKNVKVRTECKILGVDCTVYPKKYAHGFCFVVLCCGYTSTDFPISIRLTSLALWQSKDCPSASKATLMNMDKYFMWIHYERLHNHNKAKHNKTVCIFLGIYCISSKEWGMVNSLWPSEVIWRHHYQYLWRSKRIQTWFSVDELMPNIVKMSSFDISLNLLRLIMWHCKSRDRIILVCLLNTECR